MPAMFEANQVGKRQEILDKVFNIDPAQNPFLSWLATGKKPEQSLATWQAEVYPDVASTGVLDGTAATAPARVDRHTLTGCVQQFRREWGVTKRAELTNIAGIRSEAAHQMMHAMKLMKRMMEQQFLSADDSAEESSPTPWTTRGALEWLKASAQANHPVPAALRPAAAALYTGAFASLTESAFRGLLEAASLARKSPVNLDGFVGLTLKATLDDFTNVFPTSTGANAPRTVYQIRDNSTLQNVVDRLVFSAGEVRLHIAHLIGYTTSTGAAGTYSQKTGVFLDKDMWDVGYMAKPANTNLAEDGSGPKGFIDAFAVLRCKNPLGQVKVQPSS